MKEQAAFSGRESLQLINEMIVKARSSYTSKGIASIVWGSLIMLCGLTEFAEIKYKFYIGFDIWLLLILALIPQIYFGIKERKSKKFVGHDEETIRFVWIAYSVCIFITCFYSGKFGNQSSSTLIMMLFGLPAFIIGSILKLPPMVGGAIICWVLSVVSIYTLGATDMLLIAASGFFAWIIPGIFLWNRYKKQQLSNV